MRFARKFANILKPSIGVYLKGSNMSFPRIYSLTLSLWTIWAGLVWSKPAINSCNISDKSGLSFGQLHFGLDPMDHRTQRGVKHLPFMSGPECWEIYGHLTLFSRQIETFQVVMI